MKKFTLTEKKLTINKEKRGDFPLTAFPSNASLYSQRDDLSRNSTL